ncbi:hypothetical protein GS481_02405 [Rhodococcus hoagii]|nr:hypothetical protein [Prescottella equi]
MQGGLTAEQLAHIIATVTAKVVEELGGQPGSVTWDAVQDKPDAFPAEAHRHKATEIDDLPSGGGAGIDDTTIGTDTTWSSQQIVDDRAPADHTHILNVSEEMPPVALDEFASGMYGMVMSIYEAVNTAARFESHIGSEVNPLIRVVDSLSGYIEPGSIYAVRASDGTIALHMPKIWV